MTLTLSVAVTLKPYLRIPSKRPISNIILPFIFSRICWWFSLIMAVVPNNKAILEVITNSALKNAKKTFDDWAKTYEEVCCTF